MTSFPKPGQYQWPNPPTSVTRDLDELQNESETLLAQYADQLKLESSKSPEANPTVYEWLQQSPKTSEFVKLLDRTPSVKKGLQGDLSTCTIWAPTNEAWEHLEYDDDSQLELLLQHHVAPHTMPLTRLLETPNVPTLARPSTLNGPLPLRLRSVDGKLAIHGHSRIVKMISPGLQVKNGIVHLIDGILHLPPSLSLLSSMLPDTHFGHLRRLLAQVDFLEEMVAAFHMGGTFFAPTDEAFQALGKDAMPSLSLMMAVTTSSACSDTTQQPGRRSTRTCSIMARTKTA